MLTWAPLVTQSLWMTVQDLKMFAFQKMGQYCMASVDDVYPFQVFSRMCGAAAGSG